MQSVTVAERQEPRGGPRDQQPILPELSFVHPIPGFTDLRRFVLVRLDSAVSATAPAPGTAPKPGPKPGPVLPPVPAPSTDAVSEQGLPTGTVADGESPMYELRSLEQPEVRFIVVVPGAYFSDYEIELDDHECGDLGLTDSADALVLVMLTVGRDAASTTANLLAPVVINARTRVAAQVILTGSDWPVRAPLG